MTALEPFGTRLRRSMDRFGPLCVGIDPHAALLVDWGLPDDVHGLERFARTVVEAVGGRVAAVKPQSAFFERFGSGGVAVLERTIAAARAAGTLVVLDVKRGDIGSTAAAYADAYLDPASPGFADAITVSPYLGFGSLRPMLDLAAASGSGVFVLALTSNPEGAQVQRALAADGSGRTVAAEILQQIATENLGATPMGSVGAVVGATIDPVGIGFDLATLGGPILAPGFGAQGATAEDVRTVFGTALGSVLAASSRDILRLGPDPLALRAGALRVADGLRTLVSGAALPQEPSGR